jgi:hypothetical protein
VGRGLLGRDGVGKCSRSSWINDGCAWSRVFAPLSSKHIHSTTPYSKQMMRPGACSLSHFAREFHYTRWILIILFASLVLRTSVLIGIRFTCRLTHYATQHICIPSTPPPSTSNEKGIWSSGKTSAQHKAGFVHLYGTGLNRPGRLCIRLIACGRPAFESQSAQDLYFCLCGCSYDYPCDFGPHDLIVKSFTISLMPWYYSAAE